MDNEDRKSSTEESTTILLITSECIYYADQISSNKKSIGGHLQDADKSGSMSTLTAPVRILGRPLSTGQVDILDRPRTLVAR